MNIFIKINKLLGLPVVLFVFFLMQETYCRDLYSLTAGGTDFNNVASWSLTNHATINAPIIFTSDDVFYIDKAMTLSNDNGNGTDILIDAASGSLVMAGYNLVLSGNFTNTAGIGIVLNGSAGSTLTIGGTLTNEGGGTFNTGNIDLVLNGNTGVSLPSAITALNSLTITKSLSVDVTLNHDLTVAGSITLNSPSVCNLVLTSFNLISTGGTIALTNSAGISSTSGNISVSNSAQNLILSGNSVINKSGAGTISVGQDLIVTSGGTANVTFSGTGVLSVSRDLTIGTGNSVILAGGSATIGGNLSVTGNFNIVGSDIGVIGTTTIFSSGSLTSSGGTKSFTGLVTNNNILNLTGSTATMGSGLTNTSGTTTVGNSLAITGALLISSGSVVTGNNTLSVSSTTTIASSGTLISTGGSLIFTGLVTNNNILNLTGSTATMGSGLTNTSGTTTVGNSLAITGALLISSGSVVTGNNTLSVSSTTTIASSGTLISTGGSLTFTGLVTNNNILNLTGSIVTMGAGLTNTSGTVTVGNSLAITGALLISSGSVVTGNSTFSVSSTTTIASGASLTSSGGTKTFTGAVIFNSSAAILNLSGTTASITTASSNISGLTTGSSVDLTLTTPGTVTHSTPANISNLKSLTLNNGLASFTLGGSLTLAGALSITNGTLNTSGVSLSVGTTTTISSGGTLTSSAGIKSFTGLITNNNILNLSGSSATMGSGLTNISGTTTVGNSLAITGALLISSGSVVTGNSTFSVSSTTTIAVGASLTSSGGTKTFTGDVILGGATALLTLTGTTASLTTASADISGLTTGSGVDLTLTTPGTVTHSIPSRIDNMKSLTLNNAFASLTLGGSLTLSGLLNISAGILITNSQTLSVGSTTNIANGASLTSGGGTKIFNGIVTLGSSTAILDLSATTASVTTSSTDITGLTTGSNVDLILITPGTITHSTPGHIANMRSLTLNNASASLTLGGSLTLTGTLNIYSGTLATNTQTLTVGSTTTISGGASLTSTGATKTFTGNVINTGTLSLTNTTANFNAGLVNTGSTTLNLAGATVDFNGTITDWATNTITDNTTSITYSNAAALTLPSNDASPEIGTLIIDGGATVKLGASTLTTFGTATAGGLTLTSGYLDLNGKNAALAVGGSVITETGVYSIINTGARAYITTASAISEVLTEASGIGITINGGSPTGLTVQRYPESLNIPGGTLCVNRIYHIAFTGGGPITSVTFAYKEAELKGNTMSDLVLYEASNIAFTNNERVALTNTPTASTMLGSGGIAGISGRFYAFSVVGVVTGEIIASTGDWNNPNIWTPVGIPQETADIIIPTEVTVTIPDGFAATANNITINGTGSLVLTGADTKLILSDGGDLTVNSTSLTALSTAGVSGNAAITIPGNLSNTSTGTINLTSDVTSDFLNITIGGTFTNTGGGTITTNGGPAYGTHIILIGTTSMALPYLTTIYSLTVNKTAATVSQSSNLLIAGSNTLDVISGTYIVGNYDLTVLGTTNVAYGAVLNANYTSSSSLRNFTGAVTINGTLNSSGPRIPSGYNNTFGAVVTIGASGNLNLNYSVSAFAAASNLSGLGSASMSVLGSSILFAGTTAFTNIILYTNSNTDFEITSLTAAGAISFPVSVTNLHSLKIDRENDDDLVNLTSDLTIAQNLTLYQGTFAVTNRSLTVQGSYTDVTGDGILSAAGASLTLGGIADFGGAAADLVTSTTTNINFTGYGLISGFPVNGGTVLNDFTYNRSGETLTMAPYPLTNTFALTPEINIMAGTVLLSANNQLVDASNTTTTIGVNGVIDFALYNNTFLGTVTGTGILDADQVAGTGIVISGAYTFTGNFKTASTTFLTFNTNASNVELNSSITNLSTLTFNRGGNTLTLNNDLTLSSPSLATTFIDGSIIVNGHTLTLPGASTAAVTWDGIDGELSSTLIFTGKADLVNLGIIEDATTDFQFNDTPVSFPASLTDCNNLTLSAAGVVILLGNLNIYGNLTVGSGCTFNNSTYDVNVHGDVSVDGSGILTLNGAGSSLTLYSQLQSGNNVVYTGQTITELIIKGSGSQFIFPQASSVTPLNTIGLLTLNRASGAKLNTALTIGDATALEDLILTLGDLDLNGYTITLANTDDKITETAGNTIINTGASGDNNGYISTFGTTDNTNAQNSGIGTIAISPSANYIIRRYPKTIPVPDVGLSTSRIYRITPVPNSVTLQYDNSELKSSASDLKLHTSNALNFAVNIDQTNDAGTNRNVNVNTPAGMGNVVYSSFKTAPSANDYYALAAAPGNGGVMYTYSGTDNDYWNKAANWSPNGIPTKVDQVVIGPYTVILNGEGNIYECKTLLLNHSNATLKSYNNNLKGDNVSLRVMGTIDIASGAEILGVNGKGRLNLIIGDGVTAGVSSTILVNNDYVNTSGIWLNNLTINMADVTFPSQFVRISGDVILLANCAVSGVNAEFWGGINDLQTLTIPISSIFTMVKARFDNNANITTPSDFELTNQFLVKNGSTFIATNGTALFSNAIASGSPWNVENGGILKFWNVEFNSSVAGNFIPLGTAYVKGNFYQYNNDVFAPVSGTVIFQNTGQKEIVNTKSASNLTFYNLQTVSGSNISTSNDWQVRSEMDIKSNASLKADNGTITFVNVSPVNKYIKNESTHTLEFNNLTLAAAGTIVNTSDSWTIKGNLLSTGGSLFADKGTITFKNELVKSIDDGNSGTFKFFKLSVADGSKLTTSSTAGKGDFTIANNAANPSGSGIEVIGTGEFYAGDAAVVTTFDAGVGMSAGYPKIISKSPTGRLDFGNLVIAASANNEVTTASDFKITATGGSSFSNAGAGGKFTASAGTITFTGSVPVIESVSPAVTQFKSIRTEGITALTFPATAQEIMVAGNITIDGTSSITYGGDNNKTIFNGMGTQTVSGTSTAITPISLADIVINKDDGSDVLLGINLTTGANPNHELTLTNGILNLGSKIFNCGSSIISRINGAINGNKGTYIISSNHQATKLEDIYFTVNGIPTLYNLTVNNNHQIANNLTIDGTLNLNSADLIIGSGANTATPMKLILNGNLLKNSGLIKGDALLSRLVLQGSGTITNGLSNSYFTNPATATTVQLELARQEKLGGNLNIANTSCLRVNTGINNFDLGSYTLTFDGSSKITMLSGGIKADSGTIVLNTENSTIPSSMFRDNTVKNLTLAAADLTLVGDLNITGTLTQSNNNDILTKDNLLTFGPKAVLPFFTANKKVIGNLRRTVKNTATTFPLGYGSELFPVTMKFSNPISSQLITTSIERINPVYGRGGNANNAVKLGWTFKPEGSTPNDSMNLILQYEATYDADIKPLANTTFPAKWMQTYWQDYRNNLIPFTAAYPRIIALLSYPLKSSEYLGGTWAVFTASVNTDAAKNEAISISKNKIIIKLDTNSHVQQNSAFKISVELQDQFGRPIITTIPFEFKIKQIKGLGFTERSGVIPVGLSGTTISGLVFTVSGISNQLMVDTTNSSSDWNPGLTDVFPVLTVKPSIQAHDIMFTNVNETNMSIDWSAGSDLNYLVMVKADTLLLNSEFPVGGNTYIASTIMGAGSSLGRASVVYDGSISGKPVNITGLSPNTNYAVYVFNYSKDAFGNECYRTTAASGNPKTKSTLGSFDDDMTLGTNNTRETSKTIGTQTPFYGTIKTPDDVDWFNFTITSASPNIRGTLILTADMGNYNIELYNMAGRRMRRGTRVSHNNESQIINDLPAGTYTVKVMGINGSYSSTKPYILRITTCTNEILSVTP